MRSGQEPAIDDAAEREIYTTCTLDCPDGCGIVAVVRDGRAVRLGGHPTHEVTQGFLCRKTMRYLDRVYSPERIVHPLKRAHGAKGDAWVRASWDEALDTIAAKMRRVVDRDGPLAIMAYQRTGSWGATKLLSRRFWNLVGGVTSTSGSI